MPFTTVGRPYLEGCPIIHQDYNVAQGCEHYLYEENMASKGLNWWSQKNSRALDGEMWCVREANLPLLKIAEEIRNPFVKDNPVESKKRKSPINILVKPDALAKKRLDRYKRNFAARQAAGKRA